MKINLPIITKSFEKHHVVKDTVLKLLDNQNYSSVKEDGVESIAKTDWFVDVNKPREYWNFLSGHLWPIVLDTCIKSFHYFPEYDENKVVNVWFQQYGSGDLHNWHRHSSCSMNVIYFVELSKGNATEFKLPQSSEIYQAEAKEGDLLIFPSFLIHRSPVNNTERRRTVIAFNVA